MRSWKANLIRFSLNQDFYIGSSGATFKGIYPKYVARAVRWAKQAGLDVILDLHWTDSNHTSSTSGYMASTSTQSDKFWQQVATDFKNDPQVMFELHNEPTISDWATWKSNDQALYNAVRNAGANNIVILGGLDWAYDLSQAPNNKITDTNIAYNTHPATKRRAAIGMRSSATSRPTCRCSRRSSARTTAPAPGRPA